MRPVGASSVAPLRRVFTYIKNKVCRTRVRKVPHCAHQRDNLALADFDLTTSETVATGRLGDRSLKSYQPSQLVRGTGLPDRRARLSPPVKGAAPQPARKVRGRLLELRRRARLCHPKHNPGRV